MSVKEGNEMDFCHVLRKRNLCSTWPQKSVYVIKEMINTEQSYVTDLDTIVKVSFMWSNVYQCV